MIQGLQQAGKFDLLPLAYIFSAYTFDGKNEQQWLIERFLAMKGSLEDNYAYREMVKWAEEKSLKLGLAQGLEQGLKQGKQQGLEQAKKDMEQVVVRFVEIHFPDLVPLVRQQAALATTSQQLQEILDKLFVAHADNEAKAILLGK